MNAQSIPSSSQKKQNEFIFTQQQSTPIDLVGNTMEVIPSSINSQTSIVNESMQPQFLKIAILSDNVVVVINPDVCDALGKLLASNSTSQHPSPNI